MFKLRFVFVRSGAGGREGELGSRRVSTHLRANPCLVLNALNFFECLNRQDLKTCAND